MKVRAVGLVPLVLVLAASARAEAPRRLALSYEAGALCASEAALFAQVQKRVPLAVRVESGPSDVEARVRFERVEGQLSASVTLSSRDGSAEREVRGADCEEVTRALALIVALALDPDASGDAPALPAPPASVAPPPASPSPPRKEAPRSRVWLGIGASVGFAGGVAPEPTPYEGLFLEAGLETGTLLSPSLRLSGLRANATTETAAGNAELDWLALRTSACPLRLGSSLFARACATFDAGRLRARGYATFAPRSDASVWYGPGAALELGATLFGPLALGADLGVVAPLARDRFYFGPDVTAHRIPPLAGYFGLGLGLRS